MASINQARKPDPADQETEAPAGAEDQPDASTKEGEDRLVYAARAMVNQSHKEIVGMLQSGKDQPAQALASTVEMVMQTMADQSGGELPQDSILEAGEQILDDLGELGEAAGVFKYTPKLKGQAVQILMAEVVKGSDPEELKSAMSQVPLDKLKEIIAEQQAIATPDDAEQPAAAAPGNPADTGQESQP